MRSVTLADGRIVGVRRLTAREVAGLVEAGMDDMRGLIRLAQLSAVTDEGRPVWLDESAAGDADWSDVKNVADAALAANGLVEDDEPGEG